MTPKDSKPNTSKDATTRQRKWWETFSTRSSGKIAWSQNPRESCDKGDPPKTVMRQDQRIAVQIAHCRRYAKCFRINSTTASVTDFSPLIREGFNEATRPQTMWWQTDCLIKKTGNGGMNIWVATIDFAKAFATTHHDAIWISIPRHAVSKPYVSLLKKLYSQPMRRRLEKQRVTSSR